MKDTQLLSSGYQEDQCFHHQILIVGDGMGDLGTHVTTHVDFVYVVEWAVIVIGNLLGGMKPAHNCCSGCDGYM